MDTSTNFDSLELGLILIDDQFSRIIAIDKQRQIIFYVRRSCLISEKYSQFKTQKIEKIPDYAKLLYMAFIG